MSSSQSASQITAIPREAGDGWYVYWETANAYGACGGGEMTEEAADDLARRIQTGEVKP